MHAQNRRTGKPAKLSEADVQVACVHFMMLDGWRPLQTDPCSDRRRGTGFGEKGMADHLFIRGPELEPFWKSEIKMGAPMPDVATVAALCQVLWVEFKRPKGFKTPEHQLMWHLRERLDGFLTIYASIDFEPTFDGFAAWYRASGLLRRAGL
jgi:hypothetical protein